MHFGFQLNFLNGCKMENFLNIIIYKSTLSNIWKDFITMKPIQKLWSTSLNSCFKHYTIQCIHNGLQVGSLILCIIEYICEKMIGIKPYSFCNIIAPYVFVASSNQFNVVSWIPFKTSRNQWPNKMPCSFWHS